MGGPQKFAYLAKKGKFLDSGPAAIPSGEAGNADFSSIYAGRSPEGTPERLAH
jgi:hypothetical protein